MNNPDIEKIRNNVNRENLKEFIYGMADEAKERKGKYFTREFKEGFSFAVWMIKHFFKIR